MTVSAVLPVYPPPLAEDAATATRHAGPCAICHRAIFRGQRYALLVPDGKAAHLPCIGRAAVARRPR